MPNMVARYETIEKVKSKGIWILFSVLRWFGQV